jgi:hypothetical protein
VHSYYLKYFTYAGNLIEKTDKLCNFCGLSAFSQGESSLTLKFGSGDEQLTITVYDAAGFGGYFYISGWFVERNRVNESHMQTTDASVSFAIECAGKKKISIIPSMVELSDPTTGIAIALKSFTEYSPGAIFPNNSTARNWIPIDRSDSFECRKNEVRTFVAKFDFEPSMKKLEFNFGRSISFDGESELSPSVLFTIIPHEQFLYRQRELNLPL